jgi:RNA ligase (TIGR02306 family)
MSNWKVFKTKIEVFVHPNADTLMLGKVGSYQVVIQKGLYQTGDVVIFAPEKSVLTGDIKSAFEQYLAGPEHDRVKSIRLRGEISCGIILPKHLVPDFESYEFDEDISELLGLSKYEPPIPTQLAGKVSVFEMPFVGSHDCEHVNVYVNDLIQGERVVISEKVHGTQFILAHNLEDSKTIVSSKGMLKKGFSIDETEEGNAYWMAAKNDDIVGIIERNFKEGVVQVFGEVVPVQGGYSYGQVKPTARLFDVRVDGVSIEYDKVPKEFSDIWVPIIYDGVITLDEKEVVLYEDVEKGIRKTKIDFILPNFIKVITEEKERVSGRKLHWAEGVVIRPYIDRSAKDGTPLRLKVISKNYKESGEELS